MRRSASSNVGICGLVAVLLHAQSPYLLHIVSPLSPGLSTCLCSEVASVCLVRDSVNP
jgi:hypothetical protein